NVGFGGAVNQAASVAKAPLLLLMNPDCRLMTGAVAALASVLEREPACVVVGPRILDPDGGVQGSARGERDMLTGLFGRAGGGFDERFFLYWEDADLCRRLRGRGYEIRYVPGATAVHQVGLSSQTARRSSI